MAQLDAAAGSEVDTDTTAPDTSEAVDTTPTDNPADALYADDQPQAEPEDDEEQPLDDEEEADNEAEAVLAPASLKPEEKEQFAQLPPEAQRVFSEVLARRDRETQQGLESARSAQRDAERAAADQVAQTQRDFAARAEQLIAAFHPQPPEPPPPYLAEQNPQQYLILQARYLSDQRAYEQDVSTYNQLIGKVGGMSASSEQHFAARSDEELQQEISKLRSIPEFADEQQRPEFLQQVTDFAVELEFTPEEISALNAKHVMALHKARQWKHKAEKWEAHVKKRNERPRTVNQRFAAAPAGNAGTRQSAPTDPLKALYPND